MWGEIHYKWETMLFQPELASSSLIVLPILPGLFLHLCSFFLEWSIKKVIVLLHLGKRNGLQLLQIFRYLPVTVFVATGMLQTYGLKTPKTQESQSSSLLLESVFLPHFNSLISYDLKFERSIQLTVLCQSLKQTVQASLQAICCAVSGCYLQLFQGFS